MIGDAGAPPCSASRERTIAGAPPHRAWMPPTPPQASGSKGSTPVSRRVVEPPRWLNPFNLWVKLQFGSGKPLI